MRSVPLVSDVIRGIDFVIAAKRAGVNVRAANISLGGWYRPSEMEGSAYDYKIKELSEADIVVCMAAGNDRENIDDPAGYPGQRFYPASVQIRKHDSRGRADAERGRHARARHSGKRRHRLQQLQRERRVGRHLRARHGDTLDLPQGGICSATRPTRRGIRRWTARRWPPPHATGAAALLASMFSQKSASEIKKMILDGANGSIAKEGYSAHGALDAYEAWRQGAFSGGGGGCSAGHGAAALLALAALPLVLRKKEITKSRRSGRSSGGFYFRQIFAARRSARAFLFFLLFRLERGGTSFRPSITFMCCGQARSHWPQLRQSEAFARVFVMFL